jgi:hypothetical protein
LSIILLQDTRRALRRAGEGGRERWRAKTISLLQHQLPHDSILWCCNIQSNGINIFYAQRYRGGRSIYSSLQQRMEERADTLESNTKVAFIDVLNRV